MLRKYLSKKTTDDDWKESIHLDSSVMPLYPNQRCMVTGVGGYLPKTIIHNDQLYSEFHLNTDDAWIRTRTGITHRHRVSEDETTSDMGIAAARSALNDAHMDAADLDLIIVATSTPDQAFPSTATMVLDALGSKHAVAFDLNAACSGFLFALIMAESYLMQSNKNHALVIGSESMTRLLNWQDRSTAILFGDGAGAVIVSRTASNDRGIMGHCLFSDGKNGKALHDLHVTPPSDDRPMGVIVMDGQAVFREAVSQLISSTKALLEEKNIDLADVDWIIPHQANKRILDRMCIDMNIDHGKMLYTGDMHANTSAASIPLTWWKARQNKTIKPGQLLLLQAFGAGFTWGCCLVRS